MFIPPALQLSMWFMSHKTKNLWQVLYSTIFGSAYNNKQSEIKTIFLEIGFMETTEIWNYVLMQKKIFSINKI